MQINERFSEMKRRKSHCGATGWQAIAQLPVPGRLPTRTRTIHPVAQSGRWDFEPTPLQVPPCGDSQLPDEYPEKESNPRNRAS